MASDPNKPLLRLSVSRPSDRVKGRPQHPPKLEAFTRDRQLAKFSPVFDRLSEVLNRDPSGLELRSDPTALAPERLLVFKVRGSIGAFAAAVQKIPGLELIDEEELDSDDGDEAPVVYLMVPDDTALKKIESLWRNWKAGKDFKRGETAWRDVFALLRDLRPWGPQDRVQPLDASLLSEEIFGRADDEVIRLEIELVFRDKDETAAILETDVREAIRQRGGLIISRSRIRDISYHALLVDIPVRFVREIIERKPEGVAGFGAVMYIRPQSIASSIQLGDVSTCDRPVGNNPLGSPILALLDGVPVTAHPLLREHVTEDDQFELEADAIPVSERVHGTSMASLIVHGDLNRHEPSLPRKIHLVPVMGAHDKFPDNRLIVDIIYLAIIAMRDGPEPTAPDVLIVNLSLGNPRRPFYEQLSPWARLLDRLAYRFGILFLVSAGNIIEQFGVPSFRTWRDFEDAEAAEKTKGTLSALRDIMADRRIFSPAETVNGLTVGAYNDDAVSSSDRLSARGNVDPYSDYKISNPSSALGPGFAKSVKPDILLPGAREHLRFVRNDEHIDVVPASASRSAGIKVAAPPRNGRENAEGYTGGTSAATALASRTCHRIHDALEATYGDDFLTLPKLQRAVLLKALIAHPARWPDETVNLIKSVVGPESGRQHVRQKDNIRRFLGYGIVDCADAIACAGDRATFWATGTLDPEKTAAVSVPIPEVIGGKARPHYMSATLAWFTPTRPGRKSYRCVRLKLLEPSELDALSVKPHSNQPDSKQVKRGTLLTRCWSGDKAPLVGADMSISLSVQRDPDQGETIDEPIPFGLAVTLSMPGVVDIYEQVQQRLGIRPRAHG